MSTPVKMSLTKRVDRPGLNVTKKRKRKMKPLTEKQKQERRERLAKARENRPEPKYLSVAKNVRELPDDDHLSLKNVRSWIKSNKDEKARLKKILRTSNDRHVNNRYNIIEGYIQNMEYYIRNGIWLDLFYGENQENKVMYRCIIPAYDENGNTKRTVGVFYDDIGARYTDEMRITDEGLEYTPPKKRTKRKKKKGVDL